MIKKKEKKNKLYKCQICGRNIDTKAALMHIKAEEYLIGLIKKDHPRWQNESDTCDGCITYYRKLVKDAEI
ncbi:MAG: hypothetical protein Q8L26_08920 [Candidatus Omnitrophota bacterium]|nr:hypothetical protein [Candidatus Omnitrophota bacterium]